MKKIVFALICIVPFISVSAEAAGKKKSRNTPWYMAIKGGVMDSAGNNNSSINMGLDIGYRHNTYLSTEVELTRSIAEGKTSSGNDWNVDTHSVFAAFRTNTDLKLKGKIGLTDTSSDGNSDIGLSFGVGIGFWAAGGLMEIEYTELDDGLNFYSIGINYFF